jgi:hypothetical protein
VALPDRPILDDRLNVSSYSLLDRRHGSLDGWSFFQSIALSDAFQRPFWHCVTLPRKAQPISRE